MLGNVSIHEHLLIRCNVTTTAHGTHTRTQNRTKKQVVKLTSSSDIGWKIYGATSSETQMRQ